MMYRAINKPRRSRVPLSDLNDSKGSLLQADSGDIHSENYNLIERVPSCELLYSASYSEDEEKMMSEEGEGAASDNQAYIDDQSVHVSDTAELVSPNPTNNREHNQTKKHCHPEHKRPHDTRAEQTLIIVSFLTAAFIVAEFTGGYFSHSLAVMTDAGHLLSDLLSFLISLSAIWIGRRPPTQRHSFGFYRAGSFRFVAGYSALLPEVLGAVLSIVIIWCLTALLVYMAVQRVIHQQFEVHGETMALTAASAVLFNIIMGVVLHFGGASHSHSHGGGGQRHNHSHEHNHDEHVGHTHTVSHSPMSSPEPTVITPDNSVRGSMTVNLASYPGEEVVHTKRHSNINVRAAFVHVIGDLLQSIGVLIAAVVVWVKPEYKLADPVCTFVFSVLVMATTLTVMRDAVQVLMEGTPSDVSFQQVRADLMDIAGVRAVHNLHMWSLTMDTAALAVHLAVDDTQPPMTIMHSANHLMRHKYKLAYVTVQVEPYDQAIMSTCTDCIGPQN